MEINMYIAVINTTGYLPMGEELPEFETAAAAWEYLAQERERDEDQYIEGETDPDEDYSETVRELWEKANADDPASTATDSIYGSTPGADPETDLGLVYTVMWID